MLKIKKLFAYLLVQNVMHKNLFSVQDLPVTSRNGEEDNECDDDVVQLMILVMM